MEPSRPQNDEEAMSDFILEHKLFQYHPISGTLEPGAGQVVCLTLSHTVWPVNVQTIAIASTDLRWDAEHERLRVDFMPQSAHEPDASNATLQ